MRDQGKRDFDLLKAMIASLVVALIVVGCAAPSTTGGAADATQAEGQAAGAVEQEPMVILTTGELVSMDPMYTQSDATINHNLFLAR